MTGPEHYKEAEKCIDSAHVADQREDARTWLAEAQVHATLALAAETRSQSEAVAKAWGVWSKGS